VSLAELLEILSPEDQVDSTVYLIKVTYICHRRELIAKKILWPGCDHTKINTIEADKGIWVRRGDEYEWHWKMDT